LLAIGSSFLTRRPEVKIGSDSPRLVESTVSFEDGSFVFIGLPPKLPLYAKALFGELDSGDKKMDLSLEGVTEITLVLAATGAISGVVFDTLGNPLQDFWVLGSRTSPVFFGEPGMRMKTDETGRFSLSSLPEGRYSLVGLSAQVAQRQGMGHERILHFLNKDKEAVIQLDSGEHLNELSLVYKKTEESISERVVTHRGKSVAGVEVLAEATNSGVTAFAETDKNGLFEIIDLNNAQYDLRSYHPEAVNWF